MDLYEFENATGSRPEAHSNDATAGTSSGANASAATQPSLNEEVQQAIGVLGSWWGGFRKQSTVVLSSARKDFGQVVQQAQKEIGKLSAARTSSEVTDAAAGTAGVTRKSSEGAEASAAAATETSPRSSPRSSTDRAQPSSPTAMLFSFLPQGLAQNLSAAPAQIQTTLQRTLATPEIQNLRSSITTNLSNLGSTVQSSVQSVQANPQVQNLTSSVQNLPASVGNLRLNAVEGFVLEKGEEFWKGAGEFFREAVKIVPPTAEELAARERAVGVGAGVFDGAGVWMFDDLGGNAGEDYVEEGKGKGKAGASAAGSSGGVALSRTAMLLKQLRGEPALLRVDPSAAGEGKSGDTFEWFIKELEGKGVTVGSDAWQAKCAGEEAMFEELKRTKKTLVPAEMDDITFWKRYWFRTWQIREAEEKRKALLQATTQNEEVFAWEDEEEEAPSRSETVRSVDRTVTPKSRDELTKRQAETESGKKPGPASASASASSPRESSEDSYDLVSTRSGNASGTGIAAAPVLKVVPETNATDEDEEEDDSDEEEDEEDDDEEDDDDEDEEDEDEDDDEEEDEPAAKPVAKPAPKPAAKPAAKPAEDEDDDEEESEGSDWE